MTVRRIRDLKRRLLALVEPFGASVDIKHTGSSHLRATVTRGAVTSGRLLGKCAERFPSREERCGGCAAQAARANRED